MKPLHVAFIWHMHQRNERKPLRFPLIGPLNGRFATSMTWVFSAAGFAALLTFPLIRGQKWILGASDWLPRWTRGRGRGQLGRPGDALFRPA